MISWIVTSVSACNYTVPSFVWDRLLFSNPDSRQREKVRGVFSSPDSNIEFEHHTGKLKYRDFLKLLACYIFNMK